MPPASEIAKTVAESPVVTALGRIVQFLTLPVVTIALFFLGNYLSDQHSAMAAFDTRIANVESFDGGVDKRVTALETQAQLGRADRLAFQDETKASLAKMADQQTVILQTLAAVAARLDAQDRAAARN